MSRRKDLLKKLKAKNRTLKKLNKSKKKKKIKKPKMKWKGKRPPLFPSQREGVDWLKENNWRGIIADSQGTGKTAQALTAIGENAAKLCPVLVVAPSSVVWNWERESYKFVQNDVVVHVVEGTKDDLPAKNAHLTIVSWDLLHTRLEQLKERKFKLIIADEAHYAKNPETQRGKALQELSEDVPHLILMTGTPLINNRFEYETLKAMIGINPPILRRLLNDVADIPPKQRIVVPVAIPDDLREEYERTHDEFAGWIYDYLKKLMGDREIQIQEKIERCLVAEPLTKVGYLRRIVGRAKVPSVAVWTYKMVKSNESVVIFGEHNEVLDLLCIAFSKLKIEFVRLDGSASRQERQMAIDTFQAGKIKVFVASKAGCEGITLTRSANLAFIERYFTPAAEEQAEDRIRRIGQTRPTKIWYFVAQDTIDERIQEILDRKRQIIQSEMLTEAIHTEEKNQIFDLWKKINVLNNISKTLIEEPHVKPKLPKLPDPKIVRAVVFDNASWGLPFVLRNLRRRGHKIRRVKKRLNFVFIETQTPNAFIRGSKQRFSVGENFDVIVGKPATDAQRMRNYRR